MKKLLTAALLGAALLTGTAGAVVEPTDAFYVADYADVLSEETEQYIIDQNQALFEATGGQIVVVAVDFMDGMDSADYAMAVAENWGGIGDAERNNGFLLVYAVGENKVWAMAGAGIEDALSASTIEGWLEDDFYDGYDAGSTTAPPGPSSTTSMAGMRATTPPPPRGARPSRVTNISPSRRTTISMPTRAPA